MFDIADLEKLASTLETNAAVAAALAMKCAKAQEMDDAAKQTKRAKSGRHYAAVCREAARRLKIRRKQGAFEPPTWEETLDYSQQKHPDWPHADVLSWWNHFESQGWLVSGKTPMRNWQKAADNGFIRWKQHNPGRAVTSHTAQAGNRAKGDPDRWEEFLKFAKRPYREFRYEADWIKGEYRKWLTSK